MNKKRLFKLGAVLALFAAGFATDLSAITYLKADAPDGGDGASWATAYRNVEQAEAVAKAADNIIYAAGGIYPVTNKMNVTSGFKIYGGFPGLSEAETLEDRNPKTHQTILTADWELDDIWIHVELIPGKYDFAKTELPNETVLSNGVIHLPPAYTGDYDCYYPKCQVGPGAGNPKCAFHVANCTSATFDGLCFTGFRSNGNDGDVINGKDKNGEIIIHDCLFIGNEPNSGQVLNESGSISLTSCRFLFCSTTSVATALRLNKGSSVVEDCEFVGSWRSGNASGGVVQLGGNSVEMRRCSFARCMGRSNGNEDMWEGSGTIFSGSSKSLEISDCVFSNCSSASRGGIGSPLFAIHNAKVSNCSFLNNSYEMIPSAGHAYTMFGNATAKSYQQSFEGCTFRGNVVRSTAVNMAGGSYAIGILGNNSPGGAISVVNCTFDSNRAESVPAEGVEAVCSRGVLSSGNSQGNPMELGVANCTFRGPAVEDVYDIVQYGNFHQNPLNVVNSIFMVDDALVAHPFYLSQPELFVLRDCTVQNLKVLPMGITESGLQCDPIPLVSEETENFARLSVLVPAAKTPGLRETADIAVNGTDVCTTYRFRLRGEETWQPLLPQLGAASADEAVPLIDAKGDSRPFGTQTRGAIQSLTPTAETGANLFIRCEPYYGGTLSSPSTQAVEPGQPIQPVTATSAENCEFLGWYKMDGTPYAEGATLEIASLAEDLELVAKFGAPKASVVFDLGEAGTFVETGTHSMTVEAGIGDAFPAIPPYTKSPDWYIYRWDLFPATVPAEGGTYRAQYVTTDVRVVYVVPSEDESLAGSDGSGDSWANAMSDLSAAYQKAGIYRGEVWMKEGVYLRTGELSGMPNVSIIGGFAGTETSASEADPEAHPTIITGDRNGDSYWKVNNKAPDEADRVAIWKDGVFQEPNPDGTDDFWQPSGNRDDNTAVFLASGLVPLTNAVLEGLTLTCFDKLFVLNSGAPDLMARHCRFLANGVSANTTFPPIQVSEGRFRAQNSEFFGNSFVCTVTCIAEGQCTSFEDCLFRENATSEWGPCLYAKRDASLLVSGCTFLRGSNAIFHDWARYSMVTNCLFRENHLSGTPGGIIRYGGYHLSDSHGVKMVVDSCFIDNRFKMTNENGFGGGCIANASTTVSPIVMNCYFGENRLEVAPNITKGLMATVFYSSPRYCKPTLLNCTMTGNVIDNQSKTFADGASICSKGDIIIANCLLENTFNGLGAEFAMLAGTDQAFGLVNTVARNDSPSYQPFRLHGLVASIANCAISRSDTYVQPEGQGGYVKHLFSEPGPLSMTKKGPGSLLARGVASSSPYTRAGSPIWIEYKDGSYNTYFYDDMDENAEKPVWRRLDVKKNTYPSLPDISLDTPMLPDAFGAPRLLGRVAYGPLNAVPGGTILILR